MVMVLEEYIFKEMMMVEIQYSMQILKDLHLMYQMEQRMDIFDLEQD